MCKPPPIYCEVPELSSYLPADFSGELGGMRYDYRRPKHPFGDKFMLAGGRNIPTGYALWMIMGQALERKYKATGDPRCCADPKVAIQPG